MASLADTFASAATATLKAQQLLVTDTPGLANATTNSAKQNIPPIAIGPSQGRFISQLCQLANAKRILELGVLGGYSTIWLATSVPGVHVTAVEIDPHRARVARENLQAAGLTEENVVIRLGAALDELPKVEAEMARSGEKFDFIFIDANWEQQTEYFDWAVKLTRKGGIVYVDNAVRQLTESLAEGDEKLAWSLFEAVKKDDRVSPMLMPTLNLETKGLSGDAIDGFLMALVK